MIYDERYISEPDYQPAAPHFITYQSRLNTFNSWRNNIRSTKEDMARAGLYYLGIHDRTKCFHCYGGLQNWEYNDDPIYEHAKWFPRCRFVIHLKGQGYVTNIVNQFPDIPRPQIYINNVSEVQTHLPDMTSPGVNLATIAANQMRINMQLAPISMVAADGTSSLRQLMSSDYVENVKNFGVDKKIIEKVVKRKFEQRIAITSTSDLLEDCWQEEENPSPDEGNVVTDSVPEEDNLTCKVCMVRLRTCVYRPCGHLCCCLECSSALTKCPICRKDITEVINI